MKGAAGSPETIGIGEEVQPGRRVLEPYITFAHSVDGSRGTRGWPSSNHENAPAITGLTCSEPEEVDAAAHRPSDIIASIPRRRMLPADYAVIQEQPDQTATDVMHAEPYILNASQLVANRRAPLQ